MTAHRCSGKTTAITALTRATITRTCSVCGVAKEYVRCQQIAKSSRRQCMCAVTPPHTECRAHALMRRRHATGQQGREVTA